jgi:hypothetical protein
MKRKSKQLLFAGLALPVLVFLGGYLLLSGGRHYSTDLNHLRAQFNQDKGKVRLLMVLSPT